MTIPSADRRRCQKGDNPSARVAAAGLDEFRKSTAKQGRQPQAGARARIALAMEGQVATRPTRWPSG
jgi:biopolymer transport protein TolQ